MSVAQPPAGGPAGEPAAPVQPRPRDVCPLCGGPLHPEQEWCLKCGAAARTRLAAAPNWRRPLVALALVIAISLGVLAAALVKLIGDSGSTSSTTAAVLSITTGAAAPASTPTAAAGATAPTTATTVAPAAGATVTAPKPTTTAGSTPAAINTAPLQSAASKRAAEVLRQRIDKRAAELQKATTPGG